MHKAPGGLSRHTRVGAERKSNISHAQSQNKCSSSVTTPEHHSTHRGRSLFHFDHWLAIKLRITFHTSAMQLAKATRPYGGMSAKFTSCGNTHTFQFVTTVDAQLEAS